MWPYSVLPVINHSFGKSLNYYLRNLRLCRGWDLGSHGEGFVCVLAKGPIPTISIIGPSRGNYPDGLPFVMRGAKCKAKILAGDRRNSEASSDLSPFCYGFAFEGGE